MGHLRQASFFAQYAPGGSQTLGSSPVSVRRSRPERSKSPLAAAPNMAQTSPAPAESNTNATTERVLEMLAELTRTVPELSLQAENAQKKRKAVEIQLEEMKVKFEALRTAQEKCEAAEAKQEELRKEAETNRKEKEAAKAETLTERDNAGVFRRQLRAAQKEANAARAEVEVEKAKAEAAVKEASIEKERVGIVCLEAEGARKDAKMLKAERDKAVKAMEEADIARQKVMAGRDAAIAALKEAGATKDLALKEARDGREKTTAALKDAASLQRQLADARRSASQASKDATSAQHEAKDAHDKATMATSEAEAAWKESEIAKNEAHVARQDADSAKDDAKSALEDNVALLARLDDTEARSGEALKKRDQTIEDLSKQLENKENAERSWKTTVRRRDQTIKELQAQVDRLTTRSTLDQSTQCEHIDPPSTHLPETDLAVAFPYTEAVIKDSEDLSSYRDQASRSEKPLWLLFEYETTHTNAELGRLVASMPPSAEIMEDLRPHDWTLSTVDKYACVRDALDTLEDAPIVDPMAGCREEAPSPQAMCKMPNAFNTIEYGNKSERSPSGHRSEYAHHDDFEEVRRDSITSYQTPASRHPVCIRCWQDGYWCILSDADSPRCLACSDADSTCVFKWCPYGDQCPRSTCVYFHNKDFHKMLNPEAVEDGDIGRKGRGQISFGTNESFRGRKRRRSPSPPILDTTNFAEPVWRDGWRRNCICVRCWETGTACHGHPSGTCRDCRAAGVECVRVRCQIGSACSAKTCPELHPGQLGELGPESRTRDGFLRASEDLSRRHFSPRRNRRLIPADREFREVAIRLARTEDGSDKAAAAAANGPAANDGAAPPHQMAAGRAVDSRLRPERSLSSRTKRRQEMM